MEMIKKIEHKKIYEHSRFDFEIKDFFMFSSNTDLIPVQESSPFYFSGAVWKICLIKRIHLFDVTVSLEKGEEDYRLSIELGIKKTDGSIVNMCNEHCVFSGDRCIHTLKGLSSSVIGSLNVKEIMQRKSEWAPFNSLTVACKFKRKLYDPFTPIECTFPEPYFENAYWITGNLEKVYLNNSNYDVTLNVKDRKFKAHKTILIAGSPVFEAMFAHDMIEAQTDVVNIQECDPNSFKFFLDFMYTGKLDGHVVSVKDVLNLYVIAQKYQVFQLMEYCTKYFEAHLTVENFFDVAVLFNVCEENKLYDAFNACEGNQLYDVMQDFFIRNHGILLTSFEWATFSKLYGAIAADLFLGLSTNNVPCRKSLRFRGVTF